MLRRQRRAVRLILVELDAFNFAILDVNNTEVRVEGWAVRMAKIQSSFYLVVMIYPPCAFHVTRHGLSDLCHRHAGADRIQRAQERLASRPGDQIQHRDHNESNRQWDEPPCSLVPRSR